MAHIVLQDDACGKYDHEQRTLCNKVTLTSCLNSMDLCSTMQNITLHSVNVQIQSHLTRRSPGQKGRDRKTHAMVRLYKQNCDRHQMCRLESQKSTRFKLFCINNCAVTRHPEGPNAYSTRRTILSIDKTTT